LTTKKIEIKLKELFFELKKERIMQTTMAVEDLKLTLPELLDILTPGDEVILTRNQQPVAKLLVPPPAPQQLPRVPGNCKGMITLLVEDDEHLKDFEEYMK
jgi:antitoxin (DNA-binding transcriptional repressor) of toxin-antitoxin stability system